MGAYDQAIAAAQRALALATASGDVVLHALANLRLGAAYQAQGDYRRAIDCSGRPWRPSTGRGATSASVRSILPAVHLPCLSRLVPCRAGQFAEGRALGDEGLRIAEAVTHPASLMCASWGIGLLALRQGDLPRALPLLERAVGICQDSGPPGYVPQDGCGLGRGVHPGRARRRRRAAAHAGDGTDHGHGNGGYQALCSLPLGEAQMLAGRLEEAHALAEQALALARAHQERGHEAYALRLLGDIAARREPLERAQAEAYYQQALALAEELGMRPLQAHCHRGLGTLYATTGQREQARAALSTAIELYRAMDMTFWLPQAEAALAQVEAWDTPESTVAKR